MVFRIIFCRHVRFQEFSIVCFFVLGVALSGISARVCHVTLFSTPVAPHNPLSSLRPWSLVGFLFSMILELFLLTVSLAVNGQPGEQCRCVVWFSVAAIP